MKEEHIKNLIKKYNNGLTSLKEEEVLLKNKANRFGSFIKSQKVEIPEKLNENLWMSFEEKIKTKKVIPIWKWSIAASVLLILSIYISNIGLVDQSENEKQMLLEEARSMFNDKKQVELIETILFEDENIIVYTKKS